MIIAFYIILGILVAKGHFLYALGFIILVFFIDRGFAFDDEEEKKGDN